MSSQSHNFQPKVIEKHECSVCFDDVLSSYTLKCEQRFQPQCGSISPQQACGCIACIDCYKKFFLSNKNVPVCMSCKAPFDSAYIRSVLPSNYIEKKLKDHLKNQLLEQERAWFSECLPLVPFYKKFLDYKNQPIGEIPQNKQKEIKELKKQIVEAKIELETIGSKRKKEFLDKKSQLHQLIFSNNEKILNIHKQFKAEPITKWQIQSMLGRYNLLKNHYQNGMPLPPVDTDLVKCSYSLLSSFNIRKPVENQNNFKRKCCTENCRGLLMVIFRDNSDLESKEYLHCCVCDITVCNDCFQPLACQKGEKDEQHKCKKQDIDQANFERKNCKPCPNCQCMIWQDGGCSHMWCSKCHYSFDWYTGEKIAVTRQTNPHYGQWARQQRQLMQNGQQVDAAFEQDEKEREILLTTQRNLSSSSTYPSSSTTITNITTINPHSVNNILHRLNTYQLSDTDNDICSAISHIQTNLLELMLECRVDRQTGLLQPAAEYNMATCRDLRIKYLAGEIDEKKLAAEVMTAVKLRQYTQALGQLALMTHQNINDISRACIDQLNQNINCSERLKEIDIKVMFMLLENFNKNSIELSKDFGYSTCKQFVNDTQRSNYWGGHIAHTISDNNLKYQDIWLRDYKNELGVITLKFGSGFKEIDEQVFKSCKKRKI